MSATRDERRRYPRSRVSWRARLWVGEEAVPGRVEDVSQYGLRVLVSNGLPLTLGTSYRISILADDREPLNVVGEIRHVADRRVGFETDRLITWGA
jgi:hypothetical protein